MLTFSQLLVSWHSLDLDLKVRTSNLREVLSIIGIGGNDGATDLSTFLKGVSVQGINTVNNNGLSG